MHQARSPLAGRGSLLAWAMIGGVCLLGCRSYVYLPPEAGKRLVLQRGAVVSSGAADGTASTPVSAEQINQALRAEQVRIAVPGDVTQAGLLLPPASQEEAFRNLAWKCTSAERRRRLIADTQYATFLGLLSAGLVSSTAAATLSGLADIPSDDTAKTVLRASGIVFGGLAVIFNSLMAATAVRKNASATRSKYGEAQLALGEAQAEWPQVEDMCRGRIKVSATSPPPSASAGGNEREPPPLGEDGSRQALATCIAERRHQILQRLSSRCLSEADLVGSD